MSTVTVQQALGLLFEALRDEMGSFEYEQKLDIATTVACIMIEDGGHEPGQIDASGAQVRERSMLAFAAGLMMLPDRRAS